MEGLDQRENEINLLLEREFQLITDNIDGKNSNKKYESIICGALFFRGMRIPIRYSKHLNIFFTKGYGPLDIDIQVHSVKKINLEAIRNINDYDGLIICNGLKYKLTLLNHLGAFEVEEVNER